MLVRPVETHKIEPGEDLFKILGQYVPRLEENSVVAVSSKIVALCQGRVVKKDRISKADLIKKECAWYIDGTEMQEHGIFITIKNGTLIASAGIDESNGRGIYMLWPSDIPEVCVKIWDFLKKKNGIRNLGIIITDSKTSPLKWGVTGVGIGWCGFKPLYDYRNTPDIWDQKLRVTTANHMEALAVAAVHEMGEGAEQTPIAVISDVKKIAFCDYPPSAKDIAALNISRDEDLYAPILKAVDWRKGGCIDE